VRTINSFSYLTTNHYLILSKLPCIEIIVVHAVNYLHAVKELSKFIYMNVKGIKSSHLLGTDMKKGTFPIISESTVAKASRGNQLGAKG
jgi:hypothetical protein